MSTIAKMQKEELGKVRGGLITSIFNFSVEDLIRRGKEAKASLKPAGGGAPSGDLKSI